MKKQYVKVYGGGFKKCLYFSSTRLFFSDYGKTWALTKEELL